MSGRHVVGIMGAGRMAQGFDRPGDPHVVTLAHAITSSADFGLGGFFDIDPRRAESAELKWGCPASPRNREEWLDRGWDVICIATPDSEHAADLRDVLARRPRAVLVEKPVAIDGREAEALLQEACRHGIPLLVNYPRRWHSGVTMVAEMIRAGRIGRPATATFICSGGIVHNGVHMLDLFHGWWGGAWDVTLRSRHGNVTCLMFERADEAVEAIFVDLPAAEYYVWEMQVYCAKGKVELSHSPEVLSVCFPQSHHVYNSFSVLTPAQKFDMEAEPLLSRAMGKLAQLIADPEEARSHCRLEIGSQGFSGRVLRFLTKD